MIAKGQKISDRYQIIKSIGEGGMANVFLAFDTILERNVNKLKVCLTTSSINNINIFSCY